VSFFPGTFIPTGMGTSARYSHLVDNLLTPRLMAFRMIHIDDEVASMRPDGLTWGVTFGNWLEGSKLVILKNGKMLEDTDITDIDYVHGTFKVGTPDIDGQRVARDSVVVSYVFDYFPQNILEGFIYAAVSLVNVTGQGALTSYSVDEAPDNWDGVIADLAFAMAMEKSPRFSTKLAILLKSVINLA